jgi:hypothetical protein
MVGGRGGRLEGGWLAVNITRRVGVGTSVYIHTTVHNVLYPRYTQKRLGDPGIPMGGYLIPGPANSSQLFLTKVLNQGLGKDASYHVVWHWAPRTKQQRAGRSFPERFLLAIQPFMLDHEPLQETGGDDCLWKRRSQRPKSGDGLVLVTNSHDSTVISQMIGAYNRRVGMLGAAQRSSIEGCSCLCPE